MHEEARMSLNSEIERFGRDVETMAALREELEKIGTNPAAVVEFANSKGYNFTLADVQSLAAEAELTDAQLAAVAGGAFVDDYLGLQRQMQDENRRFSMISNIIKSKNDTAKNSINNIR
jgi:predicted ribosomally synthesized peptide with nif11-like leader